MTLSANTIVTVGTSTGGNTTTILGTWSQFVANLNAGITYSAGGPYPGGYSGFSAYMQGTTSGVTSLVSPAYPTVLTPGTQINAIQLTAAFLSAIAQWASIRQAHYYYSIIGGSTTDLGTGVSYLASSYAGSVPAPGSPTAGELITAVSGTKYAFPFSDTITSSVSSYNLRTQASAAGWDGVTPLGASVTILGGVTVGGTATANTVAFTTGLGLPTGSSLTLTVNSGATIIGSSSTALQLLIPTRLLNYGTIGGTLLSAQTFSSSIGDGGQLSAAGYNPAWGNNPNDQSGWPYAVWRANGDSAGTTYTAYYPFTVPATQTLYYTLGCDNIGALYYAIAPTSATDPTTLTYNTVTTGVGFPGQNSWANLGSFTAGQIVWVKVTYLNQGGPYAMTFAVSTSQSSNGIIIDSQSLNGAGWPIYGSGSSTLGVDGTSNYGPDSPGPGTILNGTNVGTQASWTWAQRSTVTHPLQVFMQQLYNNYVTNVRNVSAGDITLSVCHSSCHSSCHNARGRR